MNDKSLKGYTVRNIYKKGIAYKSRYPTNDCEHNKLRNLQLGFNVFKENAADMSTLKKSIYEANNMAIQIKITPYVRLAFERALWNYSNDGGVPGSASTGTFLLSIKQYIIDSAGLPCGSYGYFMSNAMRGSTPATTGLSLALGDLPDNKDLSNDELVISSGLPNAEKITED